ncbi:hypothetical protein Taro_029113 [Colocasia esculenta]|uniref:Uncharacterized protein n=1 Tax=Colocasia esculenta TaxID=4460 RepID=A0A843VD02_COLES|nr:hypothetical protein [Colocasia esculenta]
MDLHRSLPYAAHLTAVFEHFGVSLANEKAQTIPKFNIYCLKHLQKFMGFRIEGDQVRRGPVIEAPDAPEEVDPPPAVHSPQPVQVNQPPSEIRVTIPQDIPQSPTMHASSPLIPDVDPPSFFPQFHGSASTSTGGPSVPPKLYSFLEDKFGTITSSIQQMSENFELRIQRLENSMTGQFIKQKEAADHATQRFNRLIGTLGDASVQLKEHQDQLEKVLQGILANTQKNLFNSQEVVTQISKTRLSFAHMVDDMEGVKYYSQQQDETNHGETQLLEPRKPTTNHLKGKGVSLTKRDPVGQLTPTGLNQGLLFSVLTPQSLATLATCAHYRRSLSRLVHDRFSPYARPSGREGAPRRPARNHHKEYAQDRVALGVLAH